MIQDDFYTQAASGILIVPSSSKMRIWRSKFICRTYPHHQQQHHLCNKRFIHKGAATSIDTAAFLKKKLNDDGLMQRTIAKAGWTVNPLTYGLPRSIERHFDTAIEPSLVAASLFGGQNMIQVYAPRVDSAPVKRALDTLIGQG